MSSIKNTFRACSRHFLGAISFYLFIEYFLQKMWGKTNSLFMKKLYPFSQNLEKALTLNGKPIAKRINLFGYLSTQLVVTCSMLAIETPEQGVKYVQS